jgi:hypothetical protein
MQFFTGLVQNNTAYSQELADIFLPGIAADPPTPPQFDATDPVRWYQELNEYTGQVGARALQEYQSFLEKVSDGEIEPGRIQEASSEYLERRLPEQLRSLGRLYFDLLNGLNDLRADYEEEYLTGILASADRSGEQPFILDLVARLGESASASLSLGNTRDEPAIIYCTVTNVRRADGVGPAFTPDIFISPERLHLQPGEEAKVFLSLRLDEEGYEPGVAYVGALYVIGHGEPRFEVPLRILATPATSGS